MNGADQISHGLLITIGYGVTWLSIAFYLLHIRRRERDARRDVEGRR